MTLWKNYHLAQSITDALETLSAAPGFSRLVAGGTDLLLDIQQGRHEPVHTLVDVTQIPEMTLLEIRQESLFIGAALPLNKILSSTLVIQHARALFDAASLIGGPQVRNVATLGGNVAHALPAADGTIALLALGTQAEIADLQGRRRVPFEDMFLGPGRSVLEAQRDLLVGFHVPLAKVGQASAHRRVMRPQGVAIAILNMAVWLERRGDRIVGIRIALGPAGPVPFRAHRTEEALRGQPLDERILSNAVSVLLQEAHFRTSPHRSTAEYRQRLARVLLEEVLSVAWERAQ